MERVKKSDVLKVKYMHPLKYLALKFNIRSSSLSFLSNFINEIKSDLLLGIKDRQKQSYNENIKTRNLLDPQQCFTSHSKTKTRKQRKQITSTCKDTNERKQSVYINISHIGIQGTLTYTNN